MVTYPKVSTVVGTASGLRRQIQDGRIGIVRRICRRKAHQVHNGSVCQESVIRAQSGVRNSPVAEWVFDGLVVFPFERIRRVIHPDLEVLRAAEKEVPVIRELSRVTPGVVMDNFVRH